MKLVDVVTLKMRITYTICDFATQIIHPQSCITCSIIILHFCLQRMTGLTIGLILNAGAAGGLVVGDAVVGSLETG